MIQIIAWDRDAIDSLGKSRPELFYIVIDGKSRALGKADLIKQIKLTLPEKSEASSGNGVARDPAFAGS